MAGYNGSGTWTRLYNWVTDKKASVPITASKMDDEWAEIATALSSVLVRDGQAPMTGDLDFGGNKLVNIDAGTAAAPSMYFTVDNTSGWYRSAADEWSLSLGGSQEFKFSASDLTMTGANPVISGSDADGVMTIQSNVSASLGANILLYGPTHATRAFDIHFRTNANDQLVHDNSAFQWDFQNNSILTGSGNITSTSGNVVAGTMTMAGGSITDTSGAISFGNENISTTGTATFSGGGALTGTWSDLGTVTTVDINGGTIDGAVIGGSSAAAGDFTTLTASGVITGATVEATGDTSAGDNSALGYTATEGAILTGQGSTNDVTIKNDADATVISIPTGTTNTNFAGDVYVGDYLNASWSIIDGTADVTSTGGLGLTTGLFNTPFPASSTNCYIGIHDTGGDGNLSGDLLYKTRDLTNCSHRFFGSGGEVFSINGTNGEVDASTGGVYLGGTSAANLLDDYETGTWTPVISDAASGGNTGTYTLNNATYTKIGRLVTIQFDIANIDTTGMTSGNDLFIQSLPFAATEKALGSLSSDTVDYLSLDAPMAFVEIGAFMSIRQSVDNSSWVRLNVSQLTSGSSDFVATVTYEAS